MSRAALVTALTLMVFAPPASAVVTVLLWDTTDDLELIRAAVEVDAVKMYREHLNRFRRGLLTMKQPAIEQLLGKPVARPVGKAYAMPVAEYRAISMSGIRNRDETLNKDHHDFHLVGEVGAVEVWYGIDGETPAAVLIYLAVDWSFPKLTKGNLGQRLAWDRRKFSELVRIVAEAWHRQIAEPKPAEVLDPDSDEWLADLPGESEQPEAEAGEGNPGRDYQSVWGRWLIGAIGVFFLAYCARSLRQGRWAYQVAAADRLRDTR